MKYITAVVASIFLWGKQFCEADHDWAHVPTCKATLDFPTGECIVTDNQCFGGLNFPKTTPNYTTCSCTCRVDLGLPAPAPSPTFALPPAPSPIGSDVCFGSWYTGCISCSPCPQPWQFEGSTYVQQWDCRNVDGICSPFAHSYCGGFFELPTSCYAPPPTMRPPPSPTSRPQPAPTRRPEPEPTRRPESPPVRVSPLSLGTRTNEFSLVDDEEQAFRVNIEQVASVTCEISGGTDGDADLYLRVDGVPSQSVYDRRSRGPSSDESITLDVSAGSNLYVMVHAYSSSSGLSLICIGQTNDDDEENTTAPSPTMQQPEPTRRPESPPPVQTPSVGVDPLSLGTRTDEFSLADDEERAFRVNVAQAASVTCEISGGTDGDADLYVRVDAIPSQSVYDRSSEGFSSDESLTLDVSAGSDLYVMVHAYSSFNGLVLICIGQTNDDDEENTAAPSLTMQQPEPTRRPESPPPVQAPSVGVDPLSLGTSTNDFSLADDEERAFRVNVAQAASVTCEISGGTDGDADLYVRVDAIPSQSVYDRRSNGFSSDESITIDVSAGSDLYVMVHAYSSFNGLVLICIGQTNDDDEENTAAPSLTMQQPEPTRRPESSPPVQASSSGVDPLFLGTSTDEFSLADDEERAFRVNIAQAASVTCEISGGTDGDADLYVRVDAIPSQSVYDRSSEGFSSDESITIDVSAGSDLYVMVHAFNSSNVLSLICVGQTNDDEEDTAAPSLTMQQPEPTRRPESSPPVQASSSGVDPLFLGTSTDEFTLADDEERAFRVNIAQAASVTCEISGGTDGDADLYVRVDAIPSQSVYDRSSEGFSSDESLTLDVSAGSDLYVMVHAFNSSNVLSLICVGQTNDDDEENTAAPSLTMQQPEPTRRPESSPPAPSPMSRPQPAPTRSPVGREEQAFGRSSANGGKYFEIVAGVSLLAYLLV